MSACNLPGAPAAAAPDVATAAAMTVQAALATTPTGSSATTAAIPPTAAGATSVYTATDNVNCRMGPGTNFERVTVIPETTTVPILARAASVDWWLVDPPDTTASCWVSAEFGTTSGNVGAVPAATSSAGTNSAIPARPSNFNYTYNCVGGGTKTVTTNMTWTDASDNENGYRIYRDGVEIAELTANTTQYVDTTDAPAGHVFNFGIAAFNDVGISPQRTFSFTC